MNYAILKARICDWPGVVAPQGKSVMAGGFTQSLPEAGLAQLIVDTLNLDQAAAEIDPEAPLYGEGLGLDSIDMLEISLTVAQRFGVKLRADNEDNVEIFRSLRSLNAYIQAHRER